MTKTFCDTCDQPLAQEDNQILIPNMIVVDKKQIANMKVPMNFCGKGCLNKFLDKALNRPILVTPNSVNGGN